jgi:hypothetical protein
MTAPIWRRTLDGKREYGRIDWMRRRQVFRVVVYGPERTLSEHGLYSAAADALRAYVAEVTR